MRGNGNPGVGDGAGVVTVSAEHEYMGGTRGSGIAADVLGKSVVRGMRGVGEVCEMCMCMAWAVSG